MKFKKIKAFLWITILTAGVLSGCSEKTTENNIAENEQSEEVMGTEDDINEFRPVDCGLQAQEEYEFPFLGMKLELSQQINEKLDSRELFGFTQEDYTPSGEIFYANIRFSATTEEQRAEKGMSVDILSWEEALEKVGAIGVYQKDTVSELNQLTGCDVHEKVGESADGTYEYYISINSEGNQEFAEEIKKAKLTFIEMHSFDFNEGYTAFSMDRVNGVASVGKFETTDVNGNKYTETIFEENDLTLVNIFATWCSPCVQEMPELEALRKTYADKGVKFGVVGVVMDTKTTSGTDEGAIERAQALLKKSGAQFPFLMPDEGNMNDRLTGIEAYPETFFVDKEGNIVSEPYVGARSEEDWEKIVEQEFTNLKGES